MSIFGKIQVAIYEFKLNFLWLFYLGRDIVKFMKNPEGNFNPLLIKNDCYYLNDLIFHVLSSGGECNKVRILFKILNLQVNIDSCTEMWMKKLIENWFNNWLLIDRFSESIPYLIMILHNSSIPYRSSCLW